MIEFFVALGLLGCISLVVLFAIIATLIEYERWGWGTITAIASIAAIHFYMPQWSIIAAVLSNPWSLFWPVIIYVVAGVVWSLVKWFSYCVRKFEKYKKSTLLLLEIRPKAAEHKERIITWMVFWPFSSVATILNDPVRRLFELVYSAVGNNTYDRISIAVFYKYMNDVVD